MIYGGLAGLEARSRPLDPNVISGAAARKSFFWINATAQAAKMLKKSQVRTKLVQ
jgi:hypothetical protein